MLNPILGRQVGAIQGGSVFADSKRRSLRKFRPVNITPLHI